MTSFSTGPRSIFLLLVILVSSCYVVAEVCTLTTSSTAASPGAFKFKKKSNGDVKLKFDIRNNRKKAVLDGAFTVRRRERKKREREEGLRRTIAK